MKLMPKNKWLMGLPLIVCAAGLGGCDDGPLEEAGEEIEEAAEEVADEIDDAIDD